MSLPRFSPLQIALGVSLAVHVALLAVRFAAPEAFNRVFENMPLDVILVNANSNETPDKAQAIAQVSLAGGGEAKSGRATSPLPYSALTNTGDSESDAQRKIEAMIEQQTQLLAQIRQQIAALPVPDLRQSAQTAERTAQEERRRQLQKLLAEIERRINEENARPRKRYVSPATQGAAFALYYDHLRRKIEANGELHFPQSNGKKLYGGLMMLITVRSDGSVVGTEIVQSSGNPTLDKLAQSIARTAGPFGPFNPEMRRQADELAWPWGFKFHFDQTLEANVR